MTYQLGVDLGTSFTAAAISRDGRVEMVSLGTRSLEIPTVVYLETDGSLIVGEAAERRGASDPSRLAREFKRRLGDPAPILLAGSPFSAEALMAAVLRYVVMEVTAREGEPPNYLTLTRPANWGPYKNELFDQVLALAGGGPSSTTTEPEAAAVHFASTTRVAPGEIIAVYDLGGGTFDAAVLRKTANSFEPMGTPEGIEHLGGADFDEAVFGHVRDVIGPSLAQLDPEDPAVRSAAVRLRRECVDAKEALSTDTDVTMPVLMPGLQTEVRLTRQEFEDLIRPAIISTVESLGRALQSASVSAEDPVTVVLAGGSSRIPLIAEMVGDQLQLPVAISPHPKHTVAIGAAITADQRVNGAPTEEVPIVGPPPPPPKPPKPPKDRSGGGFFGRRGVLIGLAAAVAAAVAVAAFFIFRPDSTDKNTAGKSDPLTVPVTTTSAAPAGVVCQDTSVAIFAALVDPAAQRTDGTGGKGNPGVVALASRNAAELAVAEFDKANPACKVALKVFDTQEDGETAKKAAAEAVADASIIGTVVSTYSPGMIAVSGVLQPAELTFIATAAKTPGFPPTPLSAYDRLVGDDRSQAPAAATYLKDTVKATKVLIVDDGGNNYSKPIADLLQQNLGPLASGRASPTKTPEQISAAVANATQLGVDAVYFVGGPDTSGTLLAALRAAGYGGTFMTAEALDTPRLLPTAGAAGQGALLSCACAPPTGDEKFTAAYTAAYNAPPTTWAPEAYDATNILLKGIASGVKDRAAMAKFVRSYSGTGISKKISFDENGNVVGNPTWFYKVEGDASTAVGFVP